MAVWGSMQLAGGQAPFAVQPAIAGAQMSGGHASQFQQLQQLQQLQQWQQQQQFQQPPFQQQPMPAMPRAESFSHHRGSVHSQGFEGDRTAPPNMFSSRGSVSSVSSDAFSDQGYPDGPPLQRPGSSRGVNPFASARGSVSSAPGGAPEAARPQSSHSSVGAAAPVRSEPLPRAAAFDIAPPPRQGSGEPAKPPARLERAKTDTPKKNRPSLSEQAAALDLAEREVPCPPAQRASQVAQDPPTTNAPMKLSFPATFFKGPKASCTWRGAARTLARAQPGAPAREEKSRVERAKLPPPTEVSPTSGFNPNLTNERLITIAVM